MMVWASEPPKKVGGPEDAPEGDVPDPIHFVIEKFHYFRPIAPAYPLAPSKHHPIKIGRPRKIGGRGCKLSAGWPFKSFLNLYLISREGSCAGKRYPKNSGSQL
jgi:hypothetical protein